MSLIGERKTRRAHRNSYAPLRVAPMPSRRMEAAPRRNNYNRTKSFRTEFVQSYLKQATEVPVVAGADVDTMRMEHMRAAFAHVKVEESSDLHMEFGVRNGTMIRFLAALDEEVTLDLVRAQERDTLRLAQRWHRPDRAVEALDCHRRATAAVADGAEPGHLELL